ncbi:MAG: ABC transporter permease [Fimbriimonadales bacterium]|nr:ABC transporter permease [Fimbriimonadales bacterium]
MKMPHLNLSGRISVRWLVSLLIGAGVVFGTLTLLIVLAGQPVGESYRILLQGAIGFPPSEQLTPLDAWDGVLHDMTLLLLTGLSVGLALQAGLFNIGAAGQLLMGALVAAWIGTWQGIPAGVHLPLTLLVGALAGALWALVPALLKVWRGAHEVITTIMFNYIALYLTHWLVVEYLKDPSGDAPQTVPVLASAQLPPLGDFVATSWGIALAIAVAMLMWAVLYRTVWGYETRATGANRDAADAAGVPTRRRIIEAMLLAGAFAGLGGAIEVCGSQYRFFEGFPSEYGFDGIAVALMGVNHPAWTVLTAFALGALRNGAYNLHVVTGAPKEIAMIVQAALILYVAALRLRRGRMEG